MSLSLLTLSHFFNIIPQFLHQLLHNVTYTSHTVPCTTLYALYPILYHTSKGYTYISYSCSYPYLYIVLLLLSLLLYATLYSIYYTSTLCPLHSCIILIRVIVVPYGYTLYIYPYSSIPYIHLYLYSVYSLCIMYCIWFSYIVLYMKGYFTGMCICTSKACFYSCIVNFITITLYVPETLTILVFHIYKYTYFKHCKYSSTPCNSK